MSSTSAKIIENINDKIKDFYKISYKKFNFKIDKIEFNNLINKFDYYSKLKNFGLAIKVKNKIIIEVKFYGEGDTDNINLLEKFCEQILNKPLFEAYEHGVIYLEEKIRLGHNKEISEGIILPGQAGSYFMNISNAIRNLFIDYKTQTKSKFDINKNYFKVSQNWKILKEEEKLKKINSILNEISNNNSLSKNSITVNKIENDFKIFFNVDF